MAVIKYIAVHTRPKRFLKYILNGEKNEEMKFATGINCAADEESAYKFIRAEFEKFSGEKFEKRSIKNESEDAPKKARIRLHHYIQSFQTGEVTADEAHRIGVEWAKKVFGENRSVIVSTHVNTDNIHNHFAVSAYDNSGQVWYANKESLKLCRELSDKICLAHGLSIIKNPKYHANQKYGDWLARKQGRSWKEKICREIDRIVLLDNVKSLDDLVDELRKAGYEVNYGKYISVKGAANRKPVRTYRLGDGYAVEELRYRIENKNQEMSIEKVMQYQGIQREYALCLRELQLSVYRASPHVKESSFSELRRNAELLTFICERKIVTAEQFESLVNEAADKADELKMRKAVLVEELDREQKIISDSGRFVELLEIDRPTAEEYSELRKLNYLLKKGIGTKADVSEHIRIADDLKARLSQLDEEYKTALSEKKLLGRNYSVFIGQMKNDYEKILESLRREKDELAKQEFLLRQQNEKTSLSQNRKRR